MAHYLRSKREGRLDKAGSSRSKWLVVPICHRTGQHGTTTYEQPQSMTDQEKSVITLDTVHFVEEERAIHVGN